MNNLIDILEKLADLHESLFETLMKKQKTLVSAEMNPLITVLAEESKLVKKIAETENQRIALFGEQHTLSETIEQIPVEEEKAMLVSLQTKLQSLFVEIERVNRANQQLIEQSLQFTNFMMEQMVPKLDGTGIYGQKADAKETKEAVRFFDAKA